MDPHRRTAEPPGAKRIAKVGMASQGLSFADPSTDQDRYPSLENTTTRGESLSRMCAGTWVKRSTSSRRSLLNSDQEPVTEAPNEDGNWLSSRRAPRYPWRKDPLELTQPTETLKERFGEWPDRSDAP